MGRIFFWTINLKEKGTSELDNYKVGLKYDMFGKNWSGVKSRMAEVSPLKWWFFAMDFFKMWN